MTVDNQIALFQRLFGSPALAADTVPDRQTVVEMIVRYKNALYPDCVAIIGSGSYFAGTSRPLSDLDLLFVINCGQEIVKHEFAHEGWLIDLQICPLDWIDRLPMLSKHSGSPIGLFALASGQLIWGQLDQIERRQGAAKAAIDAYAVSGHVRRESAAWELVADLRCLANAATRPERMIFAVAAIDKLIRLNLMHAYPPTVVTRSAIRDKLNEPGDATMPRNYEAMLQSALDGDHGSLCEAADRLIKLSGVHTWSRKAAITTRAITEQLRLSGAIK